MYRCNQAKIFGVFKLNLSGLYGNANWRFLRTQGRGYGRGWEGETEEVGRGRRKNKIHVEGFSPPLNTILSYKYNNVGISTFLIIETCKSWH